MVTDPIADMLTRITNAGRAKHATVSLPYSKLKEAIADTLKKAGLVGSVEKKGKGKTNKYLEIELVYVEDARGKMPRIVSVKRISSPSRRVYASAKDVYVARGGSNALVLSTPKGILIDREAKKANVGGEALFRVFMM